MSSRSFSFSVSVWGGLASQKNWLSTSTMFRKEVAVFVAGGVCLALYFVFKQKKQHTTKPQTEPKDMDRAGLANRVLRKAETVTLDISARLS
jgi:hypothetical protein